jgi:CMP-N,N'-diacetyllegionaminic acid synthase
VGRPAIAPATLGVVTARGGSKGLPGKNLRLLAGKPLLAYTVEAARQSGAFDRLVLSTDDPAIAETGRALSCEVPFLRPADLARDDTPHLPVLQHAVGWLRDRDRYEPDLVMILQPTSPFRTAADIRAAIDLIAASGADSVVSVSPIPSHYHPMRAISIDAGGRAALFVTGGPVRTRINRRQELPPAWTMNGAIYLFRTPLLFGSEPTLYGDCTAAYVMPSDRGLSIDDADDWDAAERALQRSRST